jgi:hypothetical protein
MILVTLQILDHHPDGLFVGNSEYGLPFPFTTNQTGCPKFFNMVRYGGKGNVKFFSHSAHRQAVFRIELPATMGRAYLLKNCHAVLIRQGLQSRHNP